jgi:iron complex outermembrane receptor protein
VPAYTAVDLRLGYRLSADVDVALTGRNLSGGHGEFTSLQTRTEFGRNIQLQLRMRWP